MKQCWGNKRLGDICNKITDGSHNPPKGIESSEFLMLSSKNILDDLINYENPRYLTPKDFEIENKRTDVQFGNVLLTIVGTIGRVAVVPKHHPKFALQRSVAVLKIKEEILDSRFLMFSLQNILKFLTDEARGVAQKGIYLKQLKDIEIPLPPLTEQQRIVEVLDEAFASIARAEANAEQNLINARELFESYLQSVFTKKGEGWEEKMLGDIGRVSMCRRIFKNQTTSKGDIPFYKIGTFGKEPDAFITNEIYSEYRKKSSFPKVGDVLISASGTIGRRVIYNGEPAYFQDSNIVWIDNDQEQVSNEYLYHFYGACKWNTTEGATISRLYNDNLKQIKIFFPKSRTEQKFIVQKLDTLSSEVGKIEFIYQQKLNDLEELKKSILQKAFNGELNTN